MQHLASNIAHELAKFRRFAAIHNPKIKVTSPIPDSLLLTPAGVSPTPGAKDIGFTCFAAVHGNEPGGLAAVNQYLESLFSAASPLKLTGQIAFAVGNPKALAGTKRFVDRDLNRSFGRLGADTYEEQRAKELEVLLLRSRYFLDLHQTKEPSDRAFFIFPYLKQSYQYARTLNPALTIITHWGKGFSEEGQCSDEFINKKGGVGVTLELGQGGFDQTMIDCGVRAIAKAVALIGSEPNAGATVTVTGELYTWGAILPWPSATKAGEVVVLKAGLTNFCSVNPHEEVAHVGGSPVKAPIKGKILFPKYLAPEEQAKLKAKGALPTELIRILKPITEQDLPDHL